MGRLAVAGCALVICLGLGLGVCGAVVAAATRSGGAGSTGTARATPTTPTTPSTPSTPSTTAAVGPVSESSGGTPAVPAAWEALERAAAATCRGLDWAVLASIGRVESDSGRSTLPGVASGTNADGAEVIYRWDGGLRHQRDEAIDGRGSLVSEGSLARGQGGGHSGFIGSPAHDDQLSSVASGVSI